MTEAELLGLADNVNTHDPVTMTLEEQGAQFAKEAHEQFRESFERRQEKAFDEIAEPVILSRASLWGPGETETVTTVAAMQLRQMALFSQMMRWEIVGYRVEMDRNVHPAEFHVTTWESGDAVGKQEIPQTVVIADGMISMPNVEYYCSCLDDANHQGWYCEKCKKPVR